MTTDTLALACPQLLVPAGLGEDDLRRALLCLLGHAVDGGDLYFQLRRAESWSLEDGGTGSVGLSSNFMRDTYRQTPFPLSCKHQNRTKVLWLKAGEIGQDLRFAHATRHVFEDVVDGNARSLDTGFPAANIGVNGN